MEKQCICKFGVQYNCTIRPLYCQRKGNILRVEKINEIVAKNIAILRKSRRLSLEDLAKLSGVSKSMLALIEKGDGNPTLSFLWKIANGLGIPFDELIRHPDPMNHVVKISEIEPISVADGAARNYSIFPDDNNRRFSVFCLQMDVGCRWESDPHLRGTIEFFTVMEGAVKITNASEEFILGKGDSIQFRGDVPHSYQNLSDKESTAYNIMYNP